MVLITVLWVILVLSVVSFSLASAVRVEVRSSQQSFDSERAFFMAKGAAEVVYNAFAKKQDIPEDSPVRLDRGHYVFPFDAGEARVWFESSSGLIDINAASEKLLSSMFDSLGVAEETRNRLVDSILDWRDADDIPHIYGAEASDYSKTDVVQSSFPRNANFQGVDELLFVKNMTPELFYGRISVDPQGAYIRIPGVRELTTVQSGTGNVNPNVAPPNVLNALPGMTPALALRIVGQRSETLFRDANEFQERIPEVLDSDTLEYLTFQGQPPTMLVARATISASGVTRRVRLLFDRGERVQFLSYSPVIFRRVEEVRFSRWRLD